MKKALALILALCMVFALCACGGGDKPAEPTEEPQAETEGAAGGETEGEEAEEPETADGEEDDEAEEPETAEGEETGAWSPAKPVTVIVPKGAGGPTDTAVRMLVDYAKKVDPNFQATVQNVEGANGLTGMSQGAQAAADGYTLSAIVVELAMMQNIPSYNSPVTTDDFRAACICVCNPDAFVVRAGEYEDIEDFVSKMDKSTKIGNPGTNSIGDVTAKALMEAWGKEYTPVPYADGESANMQGLMSGEVDAILTAPSATLNSQIEAGEMEVLCVVGNARLENAPDAPLVSELEGDLKADLNVNAWAGLALPDDVPEDVYTYYVDLFTEASGNADFLSELNATGAAAASICGDDAQAFLDNDAAFYAEMLADVE